MSKRTCVIMQPTYLPWVGFFDLVDQADEFVFLDTVQFSKQSWEQRNRIRWAHGSKWLTIPVNQRLGQKIDEVDIVQDREHGRVHAEMIRQAYDKCSNHYGFYYPMIRDAILKGGGFKRLCDCTVDVTRSLGMMLKMEYRFRHPLLYRRSSQMKVEGGRSERLVNMCKKLNCTRYLSPVGARAYLLEDKAVFDEAGIEVVLHNYTHPEYEQNGFSFTPHLSVVDLLLNHGAGSADIMLSGRGKPIPLEESQ